MRILVDSSTVICWTHPLVILGVLGLACRFYMLDTSTCHFRGVGSSLPLLFYF